MEKLDIAIAILVILGGLSCFGAGFTRSVWGITAISAGVFTASQLWRELAPILQRFIRHAGIAKWVSIVAIVVLVSTAVDVVFERLQRIMSRGVLGWINSVVGAAFGVAASTILIAIALLLLDCYGGGAVKEAIAHSRFAPLLLEIGHRVFDFGKKVIKEQAGGM